MIVMGVEHVIVILTCSLIMNKMWLNVLFSLITTTMYIRDGPRDGRLWWFLKEGAMNGFKNL
jgi:hypothetical protein